MNAHPGISSRRSFLPCIAGILVCLIQVLVVANPNDRAWKLLLDNKPQEAINLFLANTGDRDKAVSGEAYRGISEASRFMGRTTDAAAFFLKSGIADNNVALFSAGILNAYVFGRSAEGYRMRDGYRLLGDLTRNPGLFSGEMSDLLADRYANDGDLRAASRLINETGVIRKWMFIGPFDNISNSGYNKAYPPESEIAFSKTYPGKDGNLAQWNPIDNTAYTGWIFTEHHSEARNAVHYFYCTVSSSETQEAFLSFGASGSFKVFLNGSCVLADSVYRNTGADVFMQKITLHKGDNPLLLKLCHEWSNRLDGSEKLSNFLVRFLDKNYRPVKNLAFSTNPAAPLAAVQAFAAGAPSPLVDSIIRVLSGRLAADAGDMDAAVLLMHTYNGTERFDDGQVLAAAYLKKFPKSSLWHDLYSESLLRSKKYTEGETELKTAYALCRLNFEAWENELHTVSRTSEAGKSLEFLDSSPKEFAHTTAALVARISAAIQQENSAEALRVVAQLEKESALDENALTVLTGIYTEQGQTRKAETLLSDFLKRQRTNASMYKALASLAVKEGDLAKATRIILESLRYSPNDADLYYYLANLNYSAKKFDLAQKYIDRSLSVRPADADALNLKGNILVSLGNTQAARKTFTDAINFTSNDFNAWENLRGLEGKPPLESLVPLPSVDSIFKAAAGWQYRSHENGAVLSRISDVFYYPSHCSRERNFLVVYLATQKAIDTWKERDIEYNGYFQVLNVARAVSYRGNGSQVQADVEDNKIVFKSLQPGDCIVLEWSLKNFYTGKMADQVYGSQDFALGLPTLDNRLRLITPLKDTIPHTIFGDAIAVSTVNSGDYRVTQFVGPAYRNVLDESFMATDWPRKQMVTYSTFAGWADIAKWYEDLTRHKLDNSLELGALADSLFAGCATPQSKVARVHDYITGTIRYSYVPFRQSGWIPQDARDVLATKIGDCKDMASLGKSLLDRAKIPSSLVLVNTGVRLFSDQAFVGPNFNHCILCYTINGADRFLDCTDNNLPLTTLPRQDQGAMALIIRPATTNTIILPFDKPENRIRQRTVSSALDDKGTLRESIRTVRTGVYAGDFRDDFRFLSDEKRKATLHQTLARSYPDLTLDSFSVRGENSVSDTVEYFYASTARNTVTLSGATAIFPLHLPDIIEPNQYPAEEKRRLPIDMAQAWFDVSSCELSGELTFPASWRPVGLPDNVSVDSPFGSYRLDFKQSGNSIVYKRKAIMHFDTMLLPSDYGRLKTFLNAVSKADAVQLLFSTR
jgi:tetratricopeptide (TPR) repeat protein